jgi:hypothetical protein
MILDACQFIAQNSQHVFINLKAIDNLDINLEGYSMKNWKNELHPHGADALNWIFVIDLLNFSFWNEKSLLDRYQVTFDHKTYTGYWSLCAAIQRCKSKMIDITNPYFYANATLSELHDAFVPDDPNSQQLMPMLEQKCQMLQQAGKILIEQYNGQFEMIVKKANHSAQALLKLIVDIFPDLFDDHVYYKSTKVEFQKRAQILIADVWACFEGQGVGYFFDIDTITMFADYRVPQTLLYLDILNYSPELLNVLYTNDLYHSQKATSKEQEEENYKFMIPRGHDYEVEIRACSIWAVELLLRSLKSKGKPNLNAIILDFYLWDYAKNHQAELCKFPIHLTRSIYY